MEIQIVSVTGINTDVLPVCAFNSAMSKGYSTMHPIQSPMMASVRELMDQYIDTLIASHEGQVEC